MASNGRAGNPNGMKWIRPEKRLAIYMRDSFCCVYCGRDLHRARAGQLSLDHLRPRSRGGSNEASNLVTACLPCNMSRCDKPWHEYATGGAVSRIKRQRRLVIDVLTARIIMGTATSFRQVLRDLKR